MENLIYIFGMAKSSLKLGTAGVRKNLELDVLRSIYFINQLYEMGINSKSYILVYNEEISSTIKTKWLKKYNFKHLNCFKILTFSHFSDEILIKIEAEKNDNKKFKDSRADYSGSITENFLKNQIEAFYNNKIYKKVTDQHDKYINGINWDYFEIFEIKSTTDNMEFQ